MATVPIKHASSTYLDSLTAHYPLKPSEFASKEEFVSSLLLIDLLESFFKTSKLILPRPIKALDIGAGPWHYAPALHSFLANYKGKRGAELHGIDIQGKHHQEGIKKRITNKDIRYHSKDLFSLHEKNAYDIIFLIHMFPPYRFKQHGIPFKPYKELFSKIFELLKKGGIVIAIAYGSPEEEYSFFEDIPKGTLVKKGRYTSKDATEIDFNLGKDTFHSNMVLIARK
jgi:hypothetical protein